MLVWGLDMDKKDKIYKSKLASKHEFFTLFFLCLAFFCVGEGFSFPTQRHNNHIYIYIYIRSYRWAPHELNFNRIETESNLEAS